MVLPYILKHAAGRMQFKIPDCPFSEQTKKIAKERV